MILHTALSRLKVTSSLSPENCGGKSKSTSIVIIVIAAAVNANNLVKNGDISLLEIAHMTI